MCDPLKNVPIYRVNEAGVLWVQRVDFGDTDEATDYLASLALEDAPRLKDIAARITKGARSKLEALATLQAWIQATIRYADDDECEAFAAPLAVLLRKQDDCDGMSTLMASLAVAIGCVFALPNMNGTRDEPAHVSTWVADSDELARTGQSWDTGKVMPSYGQRAGSFGFVVDAPIWAMLDDYRTPPGWYWAETTIAARFGEHPAHALARLGERRADIAG